MAHVVLEFAVRAALIAFGTAAILWLLRVKSPAARHAAWAGVLALMLVLPAWIAWGPRAPLPLLPALRATPTLDAGPLVLRAIQLPAAGGPLAPPRSPVWNWPWALLAVYLMGALPLLARLAIGTLRARALVRRAKPIDGRLTSPFCSAPITVGLWHPSVILPGEWGAWPQSQLEAVLAHEDEHVRRRDPLVEWLALLNRAIFWFHPLAWWLERRLSALAEEACDAAVLARGCDPYDYSGYLLEMARSIERNGSRLIAVGMAMPGSSLPRRIRQIVSRSPAPRTSRARVAAMAIACAILSGVLAAASVDRQQLPPDPPPPPQAPVPPPAIADSDSATHKSAEEIRRIQSQLRELDRAMRSLAQLASIAPPAQTAPLAAMAPPPPPAAPPPATQMPAAPPPPAPPSPYPQGTRPETSYQESRLIALFLDARGISAAERAKAIAAEQRFVREQMRPTDLVTILAWSGGRPKVVDDFTNDRDRLLQDIPGMPLDTADASTPQKRFEAMRSVVDLLSPLPQKKAVVYFTNGMVKPPDGDGGLKSVVDAAIRGNIAFYAVDVQGLDAPPPLPLPPSNGIAPGDVVSIAIDNHLIDGKYTIKADGTLSIPQLGDIRAVGLSQSELRAVITDRVMQAGISKDPRTELTVERTRTAK